MNRKKTAALLTLVILFIPLLISYAENKEGNAENLTKHCSFSLSGSKSSRKNCHDGRIHSFTKIPVKDGSSDLTITWPSETPVAQMYLQWNRQPDAYSLTFVDWNGEEISNREYPASRALNQLLDIEPSAVSVRISSKTEMQIAEVALYSEGTLPASVHPFLSTPEKLDFLVISTHPDDDQLFLGAVMPIYGAERGLTGSVLYMTCRERKRYEEALNGQWVSGLRTLPLFAWKKDGGPEYKKVRKFWDWEDTVQIVVRYLREFKPVVVVTHDLKGEYGHALHRITSEAVVEAVKLAADAGYDPESLEMFGTWQVSKLYIHLYPENTIELDMRKPLYAFDGATALEVAKKGYSEHKSQQYLWFYVSDEGIYSAARYGLAFSTVGQDTPGTNDMFENIPLSALTERGAGTEGKETAASVQEDSLDVPQENTADMPAEETEPCSVTASNRLVTFSLNRPVRAVYLSRTGYAPEKNSPDWIPAGGESFSVYKSAGDYFAFCLENNGSIAGPYPVSVTSDLPLVLDGEGTEPLAIPLKDALEKEGLSPDKMNRQIAESTIAAGMYSRAAVSAGAVTAVCALGKYGLAVPYRSAGRYNQEEEWGLSLSWGSPLEKKERDRNGTYFVYGLHCGASTVFAFKQAGLNLTSTRQELSIPSYGRLKSYQDNYIPREKGQAGDILKTSTTSHTMLIVERVDTDADGKDDSFMVLEMGSPRMILRLISFHRIGNLDCYSMDAVFEDTGAEKTKLAYWPGSFRIPFEAWPDYLKEIAGQ